MKNRMMRGIYTIFALLLIGSVFTSCKKGDHLPLVETITSGNKWTLQMGSSPADTYIQLQKLAEEKGFNDVAVVYRKPYSKPEEIKKKLNFYRAMTLQKDKGRIERVVIRFSQDKVSSIEAGGALLEEVTQWPQNVPEETAIYKNDPTDAIYAKLLAIYQIAPYNNYQIILPDKSLEKPFDPDMANYSEWAFTFSYELKPGRVGRSDVRLYFKKGKLNKIRHTYSEANVYN